MGERTKVNGSLRRLRIATGIALTTILTVMLLAEIVAGTFGVRPDYEVEPIVVGTIIGAVLLIVGIEAGNRWPFGGGGSDADRG